MSKWRSLFGQPNLPFIIIQLPNFGGTQTQPAETGSWAELREAQAKTVLNDANARLVTTIDIGNGDLHPTDKQDVGLRAAWAAANLVYGKASWIKRPFWPESALLETPSSALSPMSVRG